MELVTVHVGGAHKKKRRIAIPIEEDKGLDSLISPHFGNAPYFIFVDIEEGQVVGFYAKENEGAKLLHKKGIHAADLLIREKVDTVLSGDVGEEPFSVLGNNLIQIYHLPHPTKVQEAIRLLNENLLEKMTAPTEKPEEDKIE